MYINDFSNKKPAYVPGLDRWTEYKGIWIRYWSEFTYIYPEKYEDIYGPININKKIEVEKLIECGNFQGGFTIHICPKCDTRLIVPFSCKSRLCLSCYRKKLFGWSMNLTNILNTDLQHIHITFTIPGTLAKELRKRDYEPKLMVKIAAQLYQREKRLFSNTGLGWTIKAGKNNIKPLECQYLSSWQKCFFPCRIITRKTSNIMVRQAHHKWNICQRIKK